MIKIISRNENNRDNNRITTIVMTKGVQLCRQNSRMIVARVSTCVINDRRKRNIEDRRSLVIRSLDEAYREEFVVVLSNEIFTMVLIGVYVVSIVIGFVIVRNKYNFKSRVIIQYDTLIYNCTMGTNNANF